MGRVLLFSNSLSKDKYHIAKRTFFSLYTHFWQCLQNSVNASLMVWLCRHAEQGNPPLKFLQWNQELRVSYLKKKKSRKTIICFMSRYIYSLPCPWKHGASVLGLMFWWIGLLSPSPSLPFYKCNVWHVPRTRQDRMWEVHADFRVLSSFK